MTEEEEEEKGEDLRVPVDEIRRLISPRERTSLLNYAWGNDVGNCSDDVESSVPLVDGEFSQQDFALDRFVRDTGKCRIGEKNFRRISNLEYP